MTVPSPAYEHVLNATRLRLFRGDLTALAVDAVVNAANDHLWMGGGVAGAIKSRGGPDIEQQAIRLGPIPVGEVAVTGAGRLPARHVIHAVTMGQDLTTSEPYIRAATRNALRAAESLGLRSIAFPALGTGVGGFPLERAAAAMLEEITSHVRAGTGLREIVCALYDDQALAAFAAALAGLTGATPA
jgi:O-acetyl-ADP-ribose deacetylase (regulator of RNase III)